MHCGYVRKYLCCYGMYTEDFTGKEAWHMYLSNGAKNKLFVNERKRQNEYNWWIPKGYMGGVPYTILAAFQ